ncbi:hypothetical protein STIAU_6623 [Stigmatella aurantiaca DW4/3-1]|uniref:Uncharacterized protein n=1 Tax=Stigmatella aurantiaca (strain DW4/3-1) TaxID=378806 RepID=Q08VG3_STIAD|nr:hypothetical protein STIAU_6623 [Stigmatella aurantiaca DW4/3-1]
MNRQILTQLVLADSVKDPDFFVASSDFLHCIQRFGILFLSPNGLVILASLHLLKLHWTPFATNPLFRNQSVYLGDAFPESPTCLVESTWITLSPDCPFRRLPRLRVLEALHFPDDLHIGEDAMPLRRRIPIRKEAAL